MSHGAQSDLGLAGDAHAPLAPSHGSAFKALTVLAFAATVAGVFTTLAGDWKTDAAAWNIAALCLWLRSFPKGPDRPNMKNRYCQMKGKASH